MLITVRSDTSTTETADITFSFNGGLKLKPDTQYEIALIECSIYNSIYNISSSLANQTFKYTNHTGTLRTITIDSGNYTISMLNDFIQEKMNIYGDYVSGIPLFELVANFSTNKTRINWKITGTTSTNIDISTGNLYKLLGFTDAQKTFPFTPAMGYIESGNSANINNNIVSLSLRNSLVGASASYDNGNGSNIIYPIALVKSAFKQNITTPATPIYLPINIMDGIIYNMRVWLTTQSGIAISLNGQPTMFTFDLRESKS